jgi:hypothetical protein
MSTGGVVGFANYEALLRHNSEKRNSLLLMKAGVTTLGVGLLLAIVGVLGFLLSASGAI